MVEALPVRMRGKISADKYGRVRSPGFSNMPETDSSVSSSDPLVINTLLRRIFHMTLRSDIPPDHLR
jgi:hypothetical protein